MNPHQAARGAAQRAQAPPTPDEINSPEYMIEGATFLHWEDWVAQGIAQAAAGAPPAGIPAPLAVAVRPVAPVARRRRAAATPIFQPTQVALAAVQQHQAASRAQRAAARAGNYVDLSN